MRRLKNWMSAVLALTMTAFAAAAATATVAGCAEEAPAMSAKTYVPEKVDLVDYYGGGGDVDGGRLRTPDCSCPSRERRWKWKRSSNCFPKRRWKKGATMWTAG